MIARAEIERILHSGSMLWHSHNLREEVTQQVLESLRLTVLSVLPSISKLKDVNSEIGVICCICIRLRCST